MSRKTPRPTRSRGAELARRLDKYADEIVRNAPPFSERQRTRIAEILCGEDVRPSNRPASKSEAA